MDNDRPGGRIRLRLALPAVVILIAAACGSDGSTSDSSSEDEADTSSSSSSSSTSTSTSSSTTEPQTTEAPTTTTTSTTTTTTTTTTAAPGPWEPHNDGENDCFRNSDFSPAPQCMPPDIDTVSITRASPLTIITTFHAPVVTVDWQYTIGMDLDNDVTTGIVEGIWSEFHGIGPDLEFDYFPDTGGAPFAQIHTITPGPVFTMIEGGPPDVGPFAIWTWPDDQTLQVVISDSLLPDSLSGFEVAGQTMTPDYSDAIPNEGPLTFP